MKKESVELMDECLTKYREIDSFTMSEWKDDVGSLLHKIMSEECVKIERYINTWKEQDND